MADQPNRGRLYDIKDICQRLNAMAGTLARELLPRGSKEGPLWCEARLADGGLGDSLKVKISGPKAGKWNFYASDQHGDMLDLYCLLNNCSKMDGLKWARGRLGLGNGVAPAIDPAQRAALDRQVKAMAEAKAAEERAELEKARAGAKGAWLGGSAHLLETPAQFYFEARGIDFERLHKLGWGLNCLRFSPALWHPYAKARFPAILALAIFPDGRTASLHRTYLLERGGRWDRLRKDLDGHDGKLLYTKIHGGVIPLWRGSRIAKRGGGEVLKGHAYTDPLAGPKVTLTEGLENAMSVVQVDVDRRVAVAVSLGNALQLKLPAVYTHRTWVRDNDAPGSNADQLLDRVLDYLNEEPNEAFLVAPPAGVKDFNDGLKQQQPGPTPPDVRHPERTAQAPA